eukprot:6811317-Prymnesium_polylepis.4
MSSSSRKAPQRRLRTALTVAGPRKPIFVSRFDQLQRRRNGAETKEEGWLPVRSGILGTGVVSRTVRLARVTCRVA